MLSCVLYGIYSPTTHLHYDSSINSVGIYAGAGIVDRATSYTYIL